MGFLGWVTVSVGLMLCFVGVYPAVVIVRMAALHFRYQTYAVYLARGGEPVPIKPRTVPIPSEQNLAR